jgi:hypothetical protein
MRAGERREKDEREYNVDVVVAKPAETEEMRAAGV